MSFSHLLSPLLGPLFRHLVDLVGVPGGLFLLFVLVVIIPAALNHCAIHLFTAWMRRRTEASFHRLAERLGFQVKPTAKAFRLVHMPSTVEGQCRDRTMRFFNHGVLGEKGQWMAVAASCRTPEGVSLHMATNRWLSRQAFKSSRLSVRWDGAKMITGWSAPRLQSARTDDASFDETFLVYTNDPTCVKNILTPKVRNALLATRGQSGLPVRLRIEAGEVRYSVFGGYTVLGGFNRPDRVDHLVAQMDFVCQLAEQIETPPPRLRAFTSNLAKI